MKPSDITAAANAFKEAMKGNTVDETEIARRMAICKGCFSRRRTSGFSSRISQLMGYLTSKHRVNSDFKDYSCGVCKCSLLLLIPATEENQHKDSPAEAKKRPKTCWKAQK